MEKFRTWYTAHNTAITWFIIGLLVNNAIFHLAQGQTTAALVDIILGGINFYFWKTNPNV